MNFHATAGGFATATPLGGAATFKVNGHPAKQGAPYADPCFDDAGNVITNMRYLQGGGHPARHQAQQGGLALPAVPHARSVERRREPARRHQGAGAVLLPRQQRRVHRVLAHQPGAQQVPGRRLPGDDADRHPGPAHPPGEVRRHLLRRQRQRLELRGRHLRRRGGAGAHLRHPPAPSPAAAAKPLDRCTPTAPSAARRRPTARCPRSTRTSPQFQDADCNGVNDFLGAQTTIQRWWADPITNQDGSQPHPAHRSSPTTTSVPPPTSRRASTPAWSSSPPARPGSTTRPACSSAPTAAPPSATTAARRAGRPPSRARSAKDNYREFMIEFARLPAGLHARAARSARTRIPRSAGSTRPAPSIRPAAEEIGLPDLYAKADECPVPEGSISLSGAALPRGRVG